MSPEERHLLERAVTLAEENNKLLKKLRALHRASFIWTITYWVIIIGLSYGLYVYLEPFVQRGTAIYNSAADDVNTFKRVIDQFTHFTDQATTSETAE